MCSHYWCFPGLCPGAPSVYNLLTSSSVNLTLIYIAMWMTPSSTCPPNLLHPPAYLPHFLKLNSDKTEVLLIGTKSTWTNQNVFPPGVSVPQCVPVSLTWCSDMSRPTCWACSLGVFRMNSWPRLGSGSTSTSSSAGRSENRHWRPSSPRSFV